MATISNPFVMEVPRKLTDEELVNAIRQDIIGELEAIHEYDAHVQATDNEDAKKVLSDIRAAGAFGAPGARREGPARRGPRRSARDAGQVARLEPRTARRDWPWDIAISL